MDKHQVLKRPLATEKMTAQQGANKYAFEVDPRANKIQIKQAVEWAFKVRVRSVNTITVPGERRRLRAGWVQVPAWKKAVVTLQEGHRLQFFEGV